jgi:UDP-2,3-diacylglucosamine pyrophosphatase LpxH
MVLNLNQQILDMKLNGFSRKNIAGELGVSERLVKRRLLKIYEQNGGAQKVLTEAKYDIEENDMTFEGISMSDYFEHLEEEIQDNDINDLDEIFHTDEDLVTEDLFYFNLTQSCIDNKIIIIPFGDLHWGSANCNRKAVVNMIKWAEKRQNVFFILMGDLIESAFKESPGDGVYAQIVSPMEQFKQMVMLLSHIKDRILGIHIGNHEYRAMKSTSYNIAEMLSMFFGFKYLGYTALTTIQVGDFKYDIASTHGASGSKTIGSKLKKVIDLSQIYDADLYLMGHVHEMASVPTTIRYREDDQIKKKKRYFVLTGHCLEWKDSYAEMALCIPSQMGVPIVELSSDRFGIKVIN